MSHKRRRITPRFLLFVLVLLIALLGLIIGLYACSKNRQPSGTGDSPGIFESLFPPKATPTPEPTPTPTPKPTPRAVAGTKPDVFGIISELNLNGNDIPSYSRPQSLEFGKDDAYTQLEGVITFRGNHWRQGATYGTAEVNKKTLTEVWSISTGSLPKDYGTGSWTGSGWTGQPIIVKWPEATRRAMNLNESKKDKNDLVEVIYATMDGNIYFLDLDNGEKTRKNIDIGLPFKGAGSLDPRGYPMIYLGAGDAVPAHHGQPTKTQEFFIYSLIDGTRLYSFGKNPDPYAQRSWHAYDSSALVHAASDTLIEPGENGILYMLKLNSRFDAASGVMSIDPSDMLKLRYTTTRARDGMDNNAYWLGMEDSCVMWGRWLYVSDNCGTLLCIDTDTMEIVWAQDVLDDSNSTPVLEEENGKPYLYISTSLHWTKNNNNRGNIPIWKIDGLTGEILWQRDYTCYTVEGVSGGVEGSGLLGKGDISNLIIYPVARTPKVGSGQLVALDKRTGEDVWVYDMPYYAWSSPVAVYDKSGKAYVVICDTQGNMTLLDGKTGELLDQIALKSPEDETGNIEASPAVYGNMIVVGTRRQKIYGVRIE